MIIGVVRSRRLDIPPFQISTALFGLMGYKSKPEGVGNQSIGQYLSIHKDSFSHPPTNRRLEEAVVLDWSKVMKFKAS
ncbi:hypothetical protein AVEN_52034-1 [Araneus ventricosus]|uniref:Uncharacterized protein n=1 Tax=Araneus ventricosus TaxID=182803 RepID=A0A4Y2CGI3_ARAVE|nr:hypothetical protein AVEN_52034-1 [Araneus ventricosus]